MSHVIPLGVINQFLPQEKLGLDDHALVIELEESARDETLARLRGAYDTTGWVSGDSLSDAPELVRNIVGLFVAGRLYARQFSEDADYGERRVQEARDLLNGIVEGVIDIGVSELPDATATGEPSVYQSDPVFEMGRVF